jgi:hypothetical protein
MTMSDKAGKQSSPGRARTANLRIRSPQLPRFPRIFPSISVHFVPSAWAVSFTASDSVHTVSRRWMRFWMQNPGGAA